MIDYLYARGVADSAAALGVSPVTLRGWKWRGVPERYHAAIQAMQAGDKAVAPPPLDPIPQGHRVKGVSSLVQPDGTISAQWIKTAADGELKEETLARIMRELPLQVPVREGSVPAPITSDMDLVAVYPMGDPHVGMLAWEKEGGANFDLTIAQNLMVGAMSDLVARGPRAHTALIVNLGDFYHFDNAAHHTTKGDHSLDVDGRTAKVLMCGVQIQIAMIDAALQHHANVIYDCRAGNHDSLLGVMLAVAIKAYYAGEPRLSLTVQPANREYHRFGRVLIGTTHGDRAKWDDLPSIMASERPEDWGASHYRYWLTGHVHHERVKEHRGCRVESFRTLAPRDAWHAAQGYLSGRDMHRITYHRRYGEIGREIACVEYLQRGEP